MCEAEVRQSEVELPHGVSGVNLSEFFSNYERFMDNLESFVWMTFGQQVSEVSEGDGEFTLPRSIIPPEKITGRWMDLN
jgi:hypothetical protein